MTPQASELTFFLNVYQDSQLLPTCLAQLRRVYPQSRLIIRSDGDSDPSLPLIAETYQAEYEAGEHLFTSDKGGQIIHEMLRLFLAHESRYLLKIDPDTRVARPFYALPTSPCVFGTLQHQETLYSVQGGCIGMTLDVAQHFYESAFFLSPTLAARPPAWAITSPLWKRAMLDGLTSFDWIIGWACQQTNIEQIDWPEIMSEWQLPPENDDLRYAITHPHKPTPPPVGAKRCALRYWRAIEEHDFKKR